MKKVIITRENYEEVMFGLLENEYSKEVRDNLLDQIQADTFLAFEWKQWSKASFSESTESYRKNEAEFLESLTREEKKRGGIFILHRNFAIAASLILLLGVSVAIYNRQAETVPPVDIVTTNTNIPSEEKAIEQAPKTDNSTQKALPFVIASVSARKQNQEEIVLPVQTTDSSSFILSKQEEILPVKLLSIQEPAPVKELPKSRYTISITEESINGIVQTEASLKEKRYTMVDVMNRKDGISLSKFLDNARTQIVEDKEKHITYIEYIAADMTVLVVPLTN
ncbi:MAG: hypothetical protein ACKOXF_06830 [Chitinophagaceae bacterium]